MGFFFLRQGGAHEVWSSPDGSKRTLIPRHRSEVPSGTLARILKDLGLEQQARE
jgi:predicted RNA binding protein YcfA (HicA-like mRNA interferase family)